MTPATAPLTTVLLRAASGGAGPSAQPKKMTMSDNDGFDFTLATPLADLPPDVRKYILSESTRITLSDNNPGPPGAVRRAYKRRKRPLDKSDAKRIERQLAELRERLPRAASDSQVSPAPAEPSGETVMAAVAAAGGEVSVKILQTAHDPRLKNTGQKMKAIYAIEPLALWWDSRRWSELLKVDDRTVRATKWWRVDRVAERRKHAR